MAHSRLIVRKSCEFRVRQEADRVQIVVDGQMAIDLDWAATEQLIAALKVKKLLAEEWAKREQIATDSAILLRAGAPFALSARQDVKDEAVKRACHDRVLRQMPLIKSQEKFGHPHFETLPLKEKKP